ncbi:serine protease 1-like [Palaemon carinicauda]|uniref:serine protease 1-like n=1 Tax=Palaemon carinicauda TaxID=392227 RepID=UPI0035B63AA7
MHLPLGQSLIITAGVVMVILPSVQGSDIVKEPYCSCRGYRCGIPNPDGRVVGGRVTSRGRYPWLASLNYRGKMYCGASLVNDRFLVSAAHCVKNINKDKVEILLGSYNRSDSTEISRRVRRVKEWWTPDDYYSKSVINDIGVIELNEPVVINRYIRPVCLPLEDQSYAGEYGIVIGWGRQSEGGEHSDVVRKIKVPILSNEDCRNTKHIPGDITDTMMCAGYDAGRIDSCGGDSGGPLLHERSGGSQIDLIGIVSWGEGCGRTGYPGVYTRIQSFRNFIDTKISSGCFCPHQEEDLPLLQQVQGSEALPASSRYGKQN